jgi:ectoine hydroxylase-related dioxygenase (phytanoyl-CoA dioxygenase family)
MTWHPDQTPEESPAGDGPHRTVRLTYNIPLVDFTWANGAMEVLPSTHLLGRDFLSQNIQEISHLYPVRLDLAVGDAVLRDGNGLHRGTPNLTDAPRLMLDQTYRTASAAKREGA